MNILILLLIKFVEVDSFQRLSFKHLVNAVFTSHVHKYVNE